MNVSGRRGVKKIESEGGLTLTDLLLVVTAPACSVQKCSQKQDDNKTIQEVYDYYMITGCSLKSISPLCAYSQTIERRCADNVLWDYSK